MARPSITRAHRALIGVVAAGACLIAGIGFAGSYNAVRELALRKGFGTFSYAFPVGVDAGIVVLLALDLVLTWLRIPFPLLRQTAWLLTGATVVFNAAASYPDPLGMGMHAAIPVLFVVVVEAARHAVGRIADITADRHMESVRLVRWLLAPVPTFRLWRRMKLWELRSYDEVVRHEQNRLVYRARLRARYGRAWRRTAPIEAVLPLKLARYGVPLDIAALERGGGADPAPGYGQEPAAPVLDGAARMQEIAVAAEQPEASREGAQDAGAAARAGSRPVPDAAPGAGPVPADPEVPEQPSEPPAEPYAELYAEPEEDLVASANGHRRPLRVPRPRQAQPYADGPPQPQPQRRPEADPEAAWAPRADPGPAPAPAPDPDPAPGPSAGPASSSGPVGGPEEPWPGVPEAPEPGEPEPAASSREQKLDVYLKGLCTYIDTYGKEPDHFRLSQHLFHQHGVTGRPGQPVSPDQLRRAWPQLQERYAELGRE
ncbi:DUF2637 domain-containing protein [Streptomyces sp. NPDC001380]|uniref:DUF2637 domain-containing protein n=1 Tax=Streptomyces sp. NPDC001380 TaxID=3364566 RepID=UPI0036853108